MATELKEAVFEETDDPTILVVDDSPVDQRLAAGIIERRLGARIVFAADGTEALMAVEREAPDLILTDLQMPKMDGVQLIRALRRIQSPVPVIIMTSKGSEETAVEALRVGAASYIAKRNLATRLEATVKQVLDAAETERYSDQLLQCVTEATCRFLLPNDPALIDPLAYRLRHDMIELGICSDARRQQLYIALTEALRNAMYHGNLQVSSELRRRNDGTDYLDLIEERRWQSPFSDRRIQIDTVLTSDEAVVRIRDEGPGFDLSAVPDPTDPINLEQPDGRGLLLIQSFMDRVQFNELGNEITLIKRREESAT